MSKQPKGPGKRGPLNRKTQCIAHPKVWVRRGHHKRVVFFGARDKKGRVFTKTSGHLRRQDLMLNTHGRVISKKAHAFGKRMFKNIKPCVDARNAKAQELGLTGFVKPKRNGTPQQRELCIVMQVAAAIAKRPDANVEDLIARIRDAPSTAGGKASSAMKRPSGAQSSSQASSTPTQPAKTHLAPRADHGELCSPGTKVMLHSLTTEEGLKINGETGTVLSFGDKQPGRYQIKLNRSVAGLPAAVGCKTPVIFIQPGCVVKVKA